MYLLSTSVLVQLWSLDDAADGRDLDAHDGQFEVGIEAAFECVRCEFLAGHVAVEQRADEQDDTSRRRAPARATRTRNRTRRMLGISWQHSRCSGSWSGFYQMLDVVCRGRAR